MDNRAIILAAALGTMMQICACPQAAPLYRDEHAPIAARVQDLLSRMTLEEKAAHLQSRVTTTAFGRVKIPSPFDGEHINAEYARQFLSHGLGTFVFLDDFLGTSAT